MNNKNKIAGFSRIKILEIINVSPGIEPAKESIIAYFPCEARWCPEDIDLHIVFAKPEEFISQDVITISSYTKNIHEGIYEKIKSLDERTTLLFAEVA